MGRRRKVVDHNALQPDKSTLALLRQPNAQANVDVPLAIAVPLVASSNLAIGYVLWSDDPPKVRRILISVQKCDRNTAKSIRSSHRPVCPVTRNNYLICPITHNNYPVCPIERSSIAYSPITKSIASTAIAGSKQEQYRNRFRSSASITIADNRYEHT